jgi:osmoprotectant transport system ATP-binding protein
LLTKIDPATRSPTSIGSIDVGAGEAALSGAGAGDDADADVWQARSASAAKDEVRFTPDTIADCRESSVCSPRMIAIRGLVRRYDASNAVGPIDLEIQKGARVALLGPSGCGKSTLLRMIVGLTSPDEGHVAIDGVRLDPHALRAFRRRVGYVTQDGALWPHLTCEENVVLWPREIGWTKTRTDARVAELCAMVRLKPELLARYPFQLSGGQRQRVALMRGLALGPELLLLDEPLAALDPVTRVELQDELVELVHSLSTTIVVVSHDMQEAKRLADDFVFMRDGRIERRGAFAEASP